MISSAGSSAQEGNPATETVPPLIADMAVRVYKYNHGG